MFFFFIYKYMNMVSKELAKSSHKLKPPHDRSVYINLHGTKGH